MVLQQSFHSLQTSMLCVLEVLHKGPLEAGDLVGVVQEAEVAQPVRLLGVGHKQHVVYISLIKHLVG